MEKPPVDDLVPFRDGPFASSYLGRGERAGEQVMVKVLHAPLDRRARAEFDRERAALAKLRHPRIRPVDHVRKLPDGRLGLVSPWCPESLADRVGREGPLDVPGTLAAGLGIATALAAAHEAGVPHGGVHPGNVLFTAGGEPVVADFGVSLRRRFGRSAAAEVGFFAPETLSRAVLDEASDSYGLGVLLYFCLTGQAPFRAAAGERAEAVVLRVFDVPAPAPDRADVPPALVNLLTRLLAKEPRERPDAEAALAALTALRAAGAPGEPVFVLEPPREPAASPAASKKKGRVLALAGVAAAAVVLAAVLLWPSGGGTIPAPPPLPPAAPSSTAAGAVRIELDPPVDREDYVELSWRAPPNLDFAVLVTEAGGRGTQVVFAQRATSKRVNVARGRAYCFRIQATSPRGTWQSEAREIRGAAC